MATLKTFLVEYSSNNSGGSWWLKDEDWKKLEDEGWKVRWGQPAFCNSKFNFGSNIEPPNTCEPNKCPGHTKANTYEEAIAEGESIRWLGCIAKEATIEVKAYSRDLAEGVAEHWWANTLGYNASDEGCNCCGQPHNFYAREKIDGDNLGT